MNPRTKGSIALSKSIRNILPMNTIHREESMNSLNLDRTFTPICITTDRSVYPMATSDKLFCHTIAKWCLSRSALTQRINPESISGTWRKALRTPRRFTGLNLELALPIPLSVMSGCIRRARQARIHLVHRPQDDE